MVKWLLWWPNCETLKISNFWCSRRLGPNGHLFGRWLKEKRHYFCQDFSYGHDLHVSRMRKVLFWRPNSENLTRYFRRDRSVGQTDHYFRSYMTHKNFNNFVQTSICLYFIKRREWSNDYLDTWIVKLYQTQILGVADCRSKFIIIWCHTLKKHLGRIHIMYFLFWRRFLWQFLLCLPTLLVDALTKLKLSNSKVNYQQLTPRLTMTFD